MNDETTTSEAPVDSASARGDASPQGDLKGHLTAVSCVLVALLVAMGVRATLEQRKAYAAGVEQQSSGDVERAITSYRRAVRWYTPWGPDHGDAVSALQQIAATQSEHHPEVAVRALDGLRSGLIASRSLWQPRGDALEQANAQLPGLLVRVADRLGDKRPKDELLRRFQRDYQRPVGVSAWISLAVSVGFFLWLGALVMTWKVGIDERGRLSAHGRRWLASSFVGFSMWALTLWLAP